jgi:lipopolysaccharide/colanic/teichoic acid biosynthesis glycosyltransferase
MHRVPETIASALALIMLSPLLLAVAIAVRCGSRGPAIFRQRRLGRHARPFSLLKFRTMIHNAPDLRNDDGSAYTGSGDPRVTALGGLLRRTSLDELPQLWNVLRGDMSIVGPRPDQVDQLSYYTAAERRKLEVRPGLTGLAQISGRNRISWTRRKELDVEYVERRCLRLDLEIILKTIPYILLRKDVETGTGLNEHPSH